MQIGYLHFAYYFKRYVFGINSFSEECLSVVPSAVLYFEQHSFLFYPLFLFYCDQFLKRGGFFICFLFCLFFPFLPSQLLVSYFSSLKINSQQPSNKWSHFSLTFSVFALQLPPISLNLLFTCFFHLLF